MQTDLRKRIMERALLDKARIPATDADVWHLCQTGFDVLEESSRASVFALANGVLGVRGGLDELAGDHAAILSDAHIANPIHYHESFTGFATSSDMRFAAPSPVQIALEIDGKPFVPGGDAPLAFERKLGLVDGVLHRTTSWRIDQDRILHLTVLRLVAPGAGAHCASQIGLRVTGGSADISLSFPLECQRGDSSAVDDPRFNRATPLRRISLDESGVEACFRAGDGPQAVDLAMVQAIDIDPAAGKLILNDGRATALFSLNDGAEGMVERHVHYAFGADGPDIRWHRHEVTGSLENNDFGVDTDGDPNTLFNNDDAVLNGTFSNIQFSKSKVSWTAGANYAFTDDVGAFLRYSRGNSFPQFDQLRDGLRLVQEIDTIEGGLNDLPADAGRIMARG